MSNPESANAATAETAQTDQTTSILNTIVSTVQTVANFDATTLAKILGLWTAARAAVSTVASGVAAIATQDTLNKTQAQYTDVPLSAAALADMVVRNILPDSTGEPSQSPDGWPDPIMTGVEGNSATVEASYTGVSGDRFHAMVADTGESYGIIDALRLYNRGGYLNSLTPNTAGEYPNPLYEVGASLQTTYGITQDELYAVIAYSRVRNQFTDDLLKLSKDTISPSDAVEMAVKGVLSTAAAQDLYAAAGGMPEQFQALVDSAGDAAGPERAMELAMQGVITPDRLLQVIHMSRINPRFYDLYSPDANGLIPMAQRWLPPSELQRAVEVGLMSAADATTAMQKQGYTQDQATLYFQMAELGRIVAIRGATESQIAIDWQAGLITQAQATTALTNLGYKDWAIPIILDTYEARKVISARNNVVTRVRSSVLVGGVDVATAVADLETVGFSAPAAQEMVADWSVEANTPNKMIPYQLVGELLEASLMGSEDGVNYFRRSGYSPADAQLMVQYYQSGLSTKPAEVSGTPGPVEQQEVTPLPPPPSRVEITELPPEVN